jgi:hypothetical protein
VAIIFEQFEIGNCLWAYLFYLFNTLFENEPNGSYLSQTASKWHPVENMVVEIKQEGNLEFGI